MGTEHAEVSRAQQTIAKILDAAADQFLARSYADVTVTEIATAAQVTKGAVYHHFASKEQLYLAMMHADLEQKERLHRQSVALAGTCRERLRWLTADFLALPKRERELIGLVRRDSNIFTDAARGELVRAYQRALPDQIERIIRDGVRDGELVPCDPRLLAWQFVALVEVIMAPYCDQRFARDEDKLNYVISQFFLGCARARGGDDR